MASFQLKLQIFMLSPHIIEFNFIISETNDYNEAIIAATETSGYDTFVVVDFIGRDFMGVLFLQGNINVPCF